MTRYASSDWHLLHKNIGIWEPIRPPGFEQIIVANTRALLKPEDEFWFLGDLSFKGSKETEEILGDVFRICPSFMVRGNHDDGRTDTFFKKLGFKEVFPLYAKVDDMLLTHIPLQRVDERYRVECEAINEVFEREKCVVNVHGHTHSKMSPDPRCINVCVEVRGLAPVDLDLLRSQWNEDHPDSSDPRRGC